MYWSTLGRRTTFKNNIHIIFPINASNSNFLGFLFQLHCFNCLSVNSSCRNICSPITRAEGNSFYSNFQQREWGTWGWAGLMSKFTVNLTGCRTYLSTTCFILEQEITITLNTPIPHLFSRLWNRRACRGLLSSNLLSSHPHPPHSIFLTCWFWFFFFLHSSSVFICALFR